MVRYIFLIVCLFHLRFQSYWCKVVNSIHFYFIFLLFICSHCPSFIAYIFHLCFLSSSDQTAKGLLCWFKKISMLYFADRLYHLFVFYLTDCCSYFYYFLSYILWVCSFLLIWLFKAIHLPQNTSLAVSHEFWYIVFLMSFFRYFTFIILSA